jgi:hypothetical protein
MAVFFAAASLLAVCLATEREEPLPFAPGVFSADEGCRWLAPGHENLCMNGSFIAPPRPHEDRAAWIEALRAYRRQVREGIAQPVVRLEFDGVRAWTRLGVPVA